MTDPVLTVRALSKKYCRDLRRAAVYGLADIAAEFRPAPREATLRRDEFWALRDVSFQLDAGEALAVLGANGAGKSTLMKLLHGLHKPDAGEIRLSGRAEALIELGTGFSPVLSGRENIELRGAIEGYGRAERRSLCQAVADFSELGSFLDAPVQSYSSGMAARLAYALSVSLKPDILLVDEVLAVGDRAFQRKCIESMQAFVRNGGSLLVVSHHVGHIQALCDRALVLDRGRCVFDGGALEGLDFAAPPGPEAAGLQKTADSEGPIHIAEIVLTSDLGAIPRTGETAVLKVQYRCREPLQCIWGFSLWTADGSVCISGDYDFQTRTLEGAGELHCVIPRLPLLQGAYRVRLAFADAQTLTPLAASHWHGEAQFTVLGDTSRATSAQAAMNQLVKFEVEWG